MTQNSSTTPEVESKIPYRTKDLNQAAFIWCQEGTSLEELVGATQRGTTVLFCFSLNMTPQQLARLLLDYANGRCSIEPKKYAQKQNDLRDLLHTVVPVSSEEYKKREEARYQKNRVNQDQEGH